MAVTSAIFIIINVSITSKYDLVIEIIYTCMYITFLIKQMQLQNSMGTTLIGSQIQIRRLTLLPITPVNRYM